MLEQMDCCLVVVDVQGKLAGLMQDKETLFKNVRILISSAKLLDIPVLWCQQAPSALGPTVPQIAELLADNQPINKSSFSCCGCEEFNDKLKQTGRSQILLCGIEAHVCVFQTAIDLAQSSYQVHVIADAVSSRTAENKQIALSKITAEGAKVTSVEMALFEILKIAEHPQFRQIAKLIK